MKKRIFSIALASTMLVGSFTSAMAADTAKAEVKVNSPFVDGYPGGTFKPNQPVTRAEVAKLVAKAYDYAKQKSTFPDTKEHWATDFIGALNGDLKGYPDGNYKPDQTMTRAEFASLMSRVNKDNVQITNKSFSDIGNHWAEKDIQRMASAGVILGYEDGSFKPEQDITRAEAVAMILRNLGINPDKNIASKVSNMFTDVPNGSWFIEEVLTAATVYKYTQDDKGNRVVTVSDDVKKIESAKIVDKVITDEKTEENNDLQDLLVQIAVDGNENPIDYAAFHSEGYHISPDQYEVKDSKGNDKDSKGNDLKNIIKFKQVGEHKLSVVPVLVPENMELDEEYTVKFPIAHQGKFVTVATGTVQRVKPTNANVKGLNSLELKRESCDRTLFDLKSDTLIGGYLDGSRDETAILTKINAKVNNGTLNLLGSEIADDVKVKSSNKNVVEVEKKDGKIYLHARMTGTATITVSYGEFKITKDITVKKEERLLRNIEANVSELNLLKGQESTVILTLKDQYGDPFAIKCSEEKIADYLNNNIKGDATVEVIGKAIMEDPSKVEVKVQAKKEGNGNIYVNLVEDAFKNEVNAFKIPVNVTKVNTLGEKRVVIEDTKETEKYSKDFELDLYSSDNKEEDKVLFNVSQFTKDGAFAGKVSGVDASVDNDTIVKITKKGDSFLAEAQKEGEAVVTLTKDGKVVGKVTIKVANSAEEEQITKVNYRIDANDLKLDRIGEYKLNDFLQPSDIKNTITSLNADNVKIVNGNLFVKDKDGVDVKIGTMKVEITTYDEDGVVQEKIIKDTLDFDTVLVNLQDEPGKTRADVSIEIKSNDGKDFNRNHILNLK